MPRVNVDYAACAALAVEEFRELGLRRVTVHYFWTAFKRDAGVAPDRCRREVEGG